MIPGVAPASPAASGSVCPGPRQRRAQAATHLLCSSPQKGETGPNSLREPSKTHSPEAGSISSSTKHPRPRAPFWERAQVPILGEEVWEREREKPRNPKTLERKSKPRRHSQALKEQEVTHLWSFPLRKTDSLPLENKRTNKPSLAKMAPNTSYQCQTPESHSS